MPRMGSIVEEESPSDTEEEMKQTIESRSDEDTLADDGDGGDATATGTLRTLRHRPRGNQPSPRENQPHRRQDDEKTPVVTNRRSSRLSYSASKQLMKIRDVFSPPKLSFLSPPSQKTPSKENLQSPEKINGSDDGDDDGIDDSEEYRGPTDLHNVCWAATNADGLQDAKYFKFPQSDRESRTAKAFSIVQREASASDEDGRLPLHILSRNRKLSRSIMQESMSHDTSAEKRMDTVEVGAIVDFAVNFLLPANPSAMVDKDYEGYIPFEHGLVEWISTCHMDEFGGLKRSDSSKTFEGIENSIQQVQNVVNTSISVSRAAIAKAGRSLHLSATTTSQSLVRQSSGISLVLSRSGSGTIGTSGSANTVSSPERSEDSEVLTYDEEEGSAGATRNADPQPINDNPRHGMKPSDVRCVRFPMANTERLFPVHARLSSHAKLSLLALSAILDKLEEDAKAERRTSFRSGDIPINVASDAIKSSIIEIIASVPNLIKTLLLIDDQVERDGVFDLSIIRHVMLSGNSMGSWFTCMLRSENKAVSKRAVDYLQLLSEVSDDDRNERLANGTLSRDNAKRDELPEAVLVLEDLIPSMLGLDDAAIEHAATTPIIRRVLDTMITRPFAVSVIFFDGLFLFLLILSFRRSADGYVEGASPSSTICWIYVANANIFYFVIRELGKAVSLSMITRRTFWLKFFWGFWNIIDIFSIILALSSTIAMRVNFSHDQSLGEESSGLRWCLAVTTGMLWLKVLGFMKTINMQLATFVLAVVQITKDILWFLLILLAVIVAFAQMFYTLLLPEECATDGADENSAHCSVSEYYLKVYSILLGDFGEFDRENFHTPFAVFLFVLFSFMVVIVLLNVLIAIVSDSYEKCLIRSQYLFGRARVMILAELISFQNLLGKDDDPVKYDRSNTHIFRRCWMKQRSKGWSHGSLIFFALSAFVVLLWFVAEFVGYASGDHYGDITFSLGSIFVNVAVLVIIIAFLSRGTSGMTESSEATETVRHYNCWYRNSIQKCMTRLLGTSEAASLEKHDYDSEEWRGRANYIQREMTRIATESMAHTKNEMKTLEGELIGSDNRIWAEIGSLERRMIHSEEAVRAEIRASEQRMEMILRDIVLALGESSRIAEDSLLLRSSA